MSILSIGVMKDLKLKRRNLHTRLIYESIGVMKDL
jgi:hypothetical protein